MFDARSEANMSVGIRIKNALKKYGENTIIPNLSVDIHNGEFFTLPHTFLGC